MTTPRFLARILAPLVLLVLALGSTAHAAPARVRDALSGEARQAFDRAAQLFKVRNFNGARGEFVRAHALSGEPRVLYNVAVCEKELGRYASAIRSLRQSLREGGDSHPKSYVRRVNQTIKTLAPFVTTLTVEVDEPGASVYIDDEKVGVSPLPDAIPVEVGEHTLRVRKTGFLDSPRKFTAASGVPSTLRVDLEPVVERAKLSVRATGLPRLRRATVLVDGNEVGRTPWSGMVPVGRHTISVRADGFATASRTVRVSAGSTRRLSIPMRTGAMARLRVRSDNPDNAIYLNGRLISKGSYFGRVPAGEHVVRVTRSGADPYETEISVGEHEIRSISVKLDSSGGIPAWVWIAGGVVIAGAATTTILLTTRSTEYEGSSPGTLDPRVVPASAPIGGF